MESQQRKAMFARLNQKDLRLFHGLDNREKGIVLNFSERHGGKAQYFDLHDLKQTDVKPFGEGINDFRLYKIKLHRMGEESSLRNSKFDEHSKAYANKLSNSQLAKKEQDLIEEHRQQYSDIQSKERSSLPDSSLKDLKIKHDKTNTELNLVTNEKSRRKHHGRFSKVKY